MAKDEFEFLAQDPTGWFSLKEIQSGVDDVALANLSVRMKRNRHGRRVFFKEAPRKGNTKYLYQHKPVR